MKMRTKAAITVAAAVTALAALGSGSAYAAGSAVPISGTVYGGGGWFVSSNVRTLSSGNSTIKANFNTTPKSGLAFRVINVNTGLQLGSTIYAPPIGTWLNMTTSASSGTKFENAFEQENPCTGCSPYTFDGSEYY